MPTVGAGEIAATIHDAAGERSLRCSVGTPGTAGELSTAGSTRRLRVACLEMTTGARGYQMFAMILESDTADFAAGGYDVPGFGDVLAITNLDDATGDGFGGQYHETDPAWSGHLQLDEVGPEGGGRVRGSATGSWTQMQPFTGGAPAGDYEDHPGAIVIAFDFTRP